MSKRYTDIKERKLTVARTNVSNSLNLGEPIVRNGTLQELVGGLFDLPPRTKVKSESWAFNPDPWTILTTTERKVVTLSKIRLTKLLLPGPSAHWNITAFVKSDGWSVQGGDAFLVNIALREANGFPFFKDQWRINLACDQNDHQAKFGSFAFASFYDSIAGAELWHDPQSVREC
jgi:hypothetical protein